MGVTTFLSFVCLMAVLQGGICTLSSNDLKPEAVKNASSEDSPKLELLTPAFNVNDTDKPTKEISSENETETGTNNQSSNDGMFPAREFPQWSEALPELHEYVEVPEAQDLLIRNAVNVTAFNETLKKAQTQLCQKSGKHAYPSDHYVGECAVLCVRKVSVDAKKVNGPARFTAHLEKGMPCRATLKTKDHRYTHIFFDDGKVLGYCSEKMKCTPAFIMF